MKLRSIKLATAIYDPHSWAIVVIIAALAALYYAWPWPTWDFWFRRFAITEYVYDIIGSLFLIPIVYASIIYWWRGALVTWSLSITVMLPLLISFSPDSASLVRNVAFLSFPALLVAIITLELKWREKERKTLAEREAERQAYMSQILHAQEDERRRIAQELHDDTTQTLLAVANRAQALVSGDYDDASKLRDQAKWIRDTLLQLSEDVRRLSLSLRPGILDNMGLIPALRWLVESTNIQDNLDTKLYIKGLERQLDSGTEVIIFRMLQEALNNVRRHSKATEAVVTLEFAPESLKIVVTDNGEGFTLPETVDSLTAKGKLGLLGIQERAKLLHGTMAIVSRPGVGTKLTIEATC